MSESKHGNFVWYEHLTRDTQAALAFYTEVVGWKTQAFPEGGDYMMWVGSQGPLGGLYELPKEAEAMGAPPHWIGTVRVDDVHATAAKATELGGKILKAPEEMPGVGRFAVLADPQGATLSVFTPEGAMQMHDPSKHGEVCWRELMTSDCEAAVAFYGALFGWKILDEMEVGPMSKYRIFGLGEEQLGGIMPVPSEARMPPMWCYYVNTEDFEATFERAKQHGAKVVHGPVDIPGGGRIVQLTDPQGALFALHRGPSA